MPEPRCPVCKKPVASRATHPTFPFCSPRCRAVDLGRWLGEEYRVASDRPDEREDALPPEAGERGPHDA